MWEQAKVQVEVVRVDGLVVADLMNCWTTGLLDLGHQAHPTPHIAEDDR